MCITTMDAQLLNDTEIHTLCKKVIYLSKRSDNSEFSKALSTLRQRCGKSECGCAALTPYQRLRLLLDLELSDTLVDYSVGLSLIKNYNTVSHGTRCQPALERLIRHSLTDSSSALRDSFLDQVWNFGGLRNFKIDVIVELIQFYTKKVEEEMFAVYEETLKNTTLSEVMWEYKQFEKYVFWSSKSAKIFTNVSSVLNSCLVRVVGATNQYEQCVQVVRRFVDKVKTECAENKQDFVLLYPYEYHCLVSLLDVPPEFYPETPVNAGSVCLETVVNLIKENMKTKSTQTICLLTHFPKWVPYIRL